MRTVSYCLVYILVFLGGGDRDLDLECVRGGGLDLERDLESELDLGRLEREDDVCLLWPLASLFLSLPLPR